MAESLRLWQQGMHEAEESLRLWQQGTRELEKASGSGSRVCMKLRNLRLSQQGAREFA